MGDPEYTEHPTTPLKPAIKGSGVVWSSSLWLTGPVVLSNVNLHLQKNAMVQFTKIYQPPLVAGNWKDLPIDAQPVTSSATGAANIAITGFGIIDGGGEAWRMSKKGQTPKSQWKS